MEKEKLIHILSMCEKYLVDNTVIQTYGSPVHTVSFIADYPCSIINHDTWFQVTDHAFYQYNTFSVNVEMVDFYRKIKDIFDAAVAKVLDIEKPKAEKVQMYQGIYGFEEAYRDIEKTFIEIFGRTPLGERLDDVLKQAMAVHRYTDIANLKEKMGYALTSLLMLTKEANFHPVGLINDTLATIRGRTHYKALGRKKRVAIMGGAFNPPTVGHLKVAQLVLNIGKLFDEVWLMPCFSHMHNKKMESVAHRIKMCELLASVDRRIKVFDFECVNELGGETYHTIKKLLESDLAKENDFSMIIGMDNANTFHNWVNYTELEKLIPFIIVPRKGEPIDLNVTWYRNAPHVFLKPDASNQIPNICSTDIRTCVRDSLGDALSPFLRKNLTPEVLEYIISNVLYRQG